MANNGNLKFRIETKRDAKMIKDFILFTYRQRFPKVTRNFLIVGLLSLVFIYGGKIRAVQIICFFIGIFCLFMAFFRHLIPISRMKRTDTDYIEQNLLAYDFAGNGIKCYRNDEIYLQCKDYHKVHHVCHDEEYFFIGLNEQDLIILPKAGFTVGDPVDFEDYISHKTGVELEWIPAGKEARKIKKEEERKKKQAKAEEMQKAQAEMMAQQRAEMREAFRKAAEARKAKREDQNRGDKTE